VRNLIQWARARSLTGNVSVPLPPRSEPIRLLGEDDHIHQLDRCLSDDSIPLDLRVAGALVLLFGLLVSRVMQLSKNDVFDDGDLTYLDIDTHRLMLPPRLAELLASSVTGTTSDGQLLASEPLCRGCSPADPGSPSPLTYPPRSWPTSPASASAQPNAGLSGPNETGSPTSASEPLTSRPRLRQHAWRGCGDERRRSCRIGQSMRWASR